MLLLMLGMDTMVTDADGGDITEARGLLMLRLNLLLLLKPNLRLMPLLMPGTDTTVIPTLERDLLMPNPRLRPNPRLKPNPGITAVGVDTMAIPTGDITDTDMAVVTGGKL